MKIGAHERGKLLALLALAAVCAPLVYRSFFSSEQVPSAPASLAGLAREESGAAPAGGSALLQPGSSSSREARGRRDQPMSHAQLSALDPTLRVDLLEKSRRVEYSGDSRNIFQFYTPPPPKPVANPVIQKPKTPRPAPRKAPSNIPLKFYGVASRPGGTQKKAFLTDGEEIFIGKEGDLVGKHYKIVRIGVNSIELEDSRNQQRQQIPLLEE